MKSNVLKSFAFALAIIASFAFSNMEDFAITGYVIDTSNPTPCVDIGLVNCVEDSASTIQCTVQYDSNTELVFKDSQETTCVTELYLPIED